VLTVLMGLALAAPAGCSRTDDGSVTVARPLDVGRFWRKQPSPPTTPPVQSGLQVFPVSPAPTAAARSTRAKSSARSRRRSVKAAQPAPQKPLACRDAVTSGGRVHVVCE
jgi:hypothetical protein